MASAIQKMAQHAQAKQPTSPAPAPNKPGQAKVPKGSPPPLPKIDDQTVRSRDTYPDDEHLPLFLQEHTQKLSPQLHASVEKYTGSGHYYGINNHLRGRGTGSLSPEDNKIMVDVHHAILGTKPFPEPVTVWRGTRVHDSAEFAQKYAMLQAKHKSGEPFTMDGFVSTSLNPGVAKGFAGEGPTSVMFEIRARQGLYVNPVSQHDHERELVLDHKSKFRVAGFKEVPMKVHGAAKMVKVVQLEHVL